MPTAEKLSPKWSVAEIIDWLQKHAKRSNRGDWQFVDGCRLDQNDLVFLLNVCDQYVQLEQQFKDRDADVAKLKQLEDELEKSDQVVKKLSKQVSDKSQELSRKTQEIVGLNDKLNKPGSLWGWLATHFPNFFRNGEATIDQLKKELKAAEEKATHWNNEYQNLDSQYNLLFQNYNTLRDQQQQEWNQEKQKLISEQQSLKNKIDGLQKTNTEQLGQIASLKGKQPTFIGDYEKRENYQIATDYKAFCTGQALDITTDDIYGYLRQRKEELQDNTKFALFNAEIKKCLSETILVKAYRVQFRRLVNKQPLVEFKTFFELHGETLLSELELSNELAEQLKKTAKKGFSLVSQLVSTNPPCQLDFAENGDIFDPEEYEAATGCPSKGVVKFTVVPGVVSGYQPLMKPIVFVE
jgi:archaellum component FlaC